MSTNRIAEAAPSAYDALPAAVKAAVDGLVHCNAAAVSILFPGGEMDAEAARISKLVGAVNQFDSSYRTGVVEIIKILSDDKVDLSQLIRKGSASGVLGPFPFACLVPRTSGNGHSADRPLVIWQYQPGSTIAWSRDGGSANPPSTRQEDYRPATALETREFFADWLKNAPAGTAGTPAQMAAYLAALTPSTAQSEAAAQPEPVATA